MGMYWMPYRIVPLFALLALCTSLIFIPAVRKAGFSGWWAVASIIPVVGIVLLWIFAFARWPAQPER